MNKQPSTGHSPQPAVPAPTQRPAQQAPPQPAQTPPAGGVPPAHGPMPPYPPQSAMPAPYPPVYGPMPHYQPSKPRPAAIFTRTDRVAAWLALPLGLLLMRYFFWNPSGFATTVSVWFCLGYVLWYMIRRGFKLTTVNWINAALIVIFSLAFSFTADGFIKLCSFALIIASSVYLVFMVSSGRKFTEHFVRDQSGALIYPFWSFGTNFRAMGAKTEGEKTKSRNGLYILLGLLAGIPLFAVVIIALINSDQAMAKIMGDIGEYFFNDVFTIILQLALGIPIAMYLFGMLYTGGSGRIKDRISDETYARKSAAGRVLPQAAVYAVLTPILVLYAIYLVSQLPYFFAGFAGKLPNGFTYARYAREGFGSLVFLTVLNPIIITLTQRFTRGSGKRKSPWLKGYMVAFSLSTLVLVASAFSKLFMYISAYDLTRLRVLSAWAIALIGLIFVLLIIRQFWEKLPFTRIAVVTGVLMFGLLAFGRIDYQIARYNIEMYKNGNHKELDVEYLLYNLSDDGLLYILKNDEINTLQRAHEQSSYRNDYDTVEDVVKTQLYFGRGMLGESPMRYHNLSSLRLRQLAEEKWGKMETWNISSRDYRY